MTWKWSTASSSTRFTRRRWCTTWGTVSSVTRGGQVVARELELSVHDLEPQLQRLVDHDEEQFIRDELGLIVLETALELEQLAELQVVGVVGHVFSHEAPF